VANSSKALNREKKNKGGDEVDGGDDGITESERHIMAASSLSASAEDVHLTENR